MNVRVMQCNLPTHMCFACCATSLALRSQPVTVVWHTSLHHTAALTRRRFEPVSPTEPKNVHERLLPCDSHLLYVGFASCPPPPPTGAHKVCCAATLAGVPDGGCAVSAATQASSCATALSTKNSSGVSGSAHPSAFVPVCPNSSCPSCARDFVIVAFAARA